MSELGTIDIRGEDDVVRAHQTARMIASQLGLSTFEQTRLATATSEIARNALTYAGTGQVTISLDEEHHQIVIVVIDRGRGIEDLDAILSGTRRSPTGLGIGIPGSRRLVDSLAIETSTSGTRVELIKRLRRTANGDRQQAAAIRTQLSNQLADDPRQEIGRLVRDVAHRDQIMLDLTQELLETNRGVMALHAELEQRAEYQRDSIALRTRMLSEMGHELRTPLHSVVSIAQFMLDRLDGPLTDEQARQASIIHQIGSTLTEYIDDLLELARADAGKVPAHPVTFAVETLLRTVRRMMEPLASSPRVSLRFASATEIPTVFTDDSKVSQILRNLVGNALKYTEDGTIDVKAWLDDDHVVFEVRDTGIGIDSEHLVDIFEEFSRIEGISERRVRGTGLGLPLSRRLADLLGGSIAVTSTLGTGSTFTVTLPRYYVGEAAALRPAPDAPVAPAQPVGQPRILVIDDDEASRYVLKRWLEPRYRVDEGRGGHEGLARASATRPDAIFLDVVMPDLTGFEVLDRLKASPDTRTIPVVVYTALTLGSRDRARLASAVAILRKSTSSRIADRSAVEEALVAAGVAVRVEPHA